MADDPTPAKRPAKKAARKRPAKKAAAAAKPPVPKGPQPIRPLGQPGTDAWGRFTTASAQWIDTVVDVELLQMVCEQIDERAALRVRVLRENDWRDRSALRAIDQQILQGLSMLGLTPSDRSRNGLNVKADIDDELDRFLAGLSTPVVHPKD
jgi:hypothetical protein